MNLSLKRALFYLLVLNIGFSGVSLARYHTVITNFGAENNELPGIEFSVWVLEHEGGAGIEIGDMKPGDAIQRQITVRNWKEVAGETAVSEYDQRVWFELVTTSNLPLTFAISEGGTPLGLSEYGDSTYRSSEFGFARNVQQTRTFDLEIIWPDSIRDERYKYEIDYLILSITGMQGEPDTNGEPGEEEP